MDINENGNLSQPYPEDAGAKQAQDDEIFQRARLVNCGYFMQIILGGTYNGQTIFFIRLTGFDIDYVGAILGLVRDGSDWRLDPLMVRWLKVIPFARLLMTIPPCSIDHTRH